MQSLRPRQLLQAVKAISALLGNVETLEVEDVCSALVQQCKEFDGAKASEEAAGRLRPEILEEVGEHYATVVLQDAGEKRRVELAKGIRATLERIKEAVRKLVELYARAFRVNFSLAAPEAPEAAKVEESIQGRRSGWKNCSDNFLFYFLDLGLASMSQEIV